MTHFALVYGKEYTKIPKDLFIPPDALEVLLDSFSGPLDLLLYLIRKQNIDILDIPILAITNQYLHYIAILFQSEHKLELAGDYLLMASLLAEIKSKMLLPMQTKFMEDEEDPRLVLLNKLQTYEQIKFAAQRIDELPRRDRDNFLIQLKLIDSIIAKNQPEVKFSDLIAVMKDFLAKKVCFAHHEIERENYCIRERMDKILDKLDKNKKINFTQLFCQTEGKPGLIISFLAMLELARLELISIIQVRDFSIIYIQAA